MTGLRVVTLSVALVAGSMPAAAAAAERIVHSFELGGRVESAAAVAGSAASENTVVYLLVRPDADRDAPRRLVRVDPVSSVGASVVLADLDGRTKALGALERGGRRELVVGGLGFLWTLGAWESPEAPLVPLIEHPGFDLRSLSSGALRVGVDREIAAVELGALRVWSPAGDGTMQLVADLPARFRIERTDNGLELDGPPVVALPRSADGRRRFAVGPDEHGSRLRVDLVEPDENGAWESTETWSALPGVESVEESWLGEVDGQPSLVVRTQSAVEINVFEDQLWRLFRLGADPTRAGRGPALATSVDSKRWQDSSALLADVDGDGHTDLAIARPEGITGGDLVVEVFEGLGGGRFERRSRRTDINDAPSSFAWIEDVDGRGGVGLAALSKGELRIFRVAAQGRRALEREPITRETWSLEQSSKSVEEGPASRWTREQWLGSVTRPGRAPIHLILSSPEKGADRLIAVEGR